MMNTLRMVSVALLLAAIFTACSVIAPESSAAVFYEGEPVAIPFELSNLATETELTLVNTGEMQLNFTVKVANNSGSWLTASGAGTLEPGEEFPFRLTHLCDSAIRHEATIVIEYTNFGRGNTVLNVPVVLDCSVSGLDLVYVSGQGNSVLRSLPLRAGQGEERVTLTIHNPGNDAVSIDYEVQGATNNWLTFVNPADGSSTFSISSGEVHEVELAYQCQAKNSVADYGSARFVVSSGGVVIANIPVSLTGCVDNPTDQVVLFVNDVQATAIRLTALDPAQNFTFELKNAGSEQIVFTLDLVDYQPVDRWIDFTDPYAGQITVPAGDVVPFGFTWDCRVPAQDHTATLRAEIIGGAIQNFPITLTSCS